MSKAWDLLQKIQFYSHLFWMFFWKISNKNIGFSWVFHVFHGFSWFFHGFSRTQLPFSKQKPRGVKPVPRSSTCASGLAIDSTNSGPQTVMHGTFFRRIFGDFSDDWLVVGPPLWKILVKSIGMIIPNIWENKKWQPNHQPGFVGVVFLIFGFLCWVICWDVWMIHIRTEICRLSAGVFGWFSVVMDILVWFLGQALPHPL